MKSKIKNPAKTSGNKKPFLIGKVFSSVFLAGFLLFAMPALANYSESFEDYTAGSLNGQGNWNSNKETWLINTDFSTDGSKSVKNWETGEVPSYCQNSVDFASQYPAGSISFDIQPLGIYDNVFELIGSNLIRFASSRDISLQYPATILGTWATGTTYSILWEWRQPVQPELELGDQVRITINGSTTEWLDTGNGSPLMDSWNNLTMRMEGEGAYWDNIIYSETITSPAGSDWVPANFTADVGSYINDFINDGSPAIILVIGLALAILVINWLLGLFIKTKKK
jgi:hypothetical protein